LNLAKREIFFVSFIAAPLWKIINTIYSNDWIDMVNNSERNVEEWKKIRDSEMERLK